METLCTFYTCDRQKWRMWLEANFEKEREIWFVFPMKASGEKSLSYNDAVEEALCFGWIDSTIRNIDPLHRAQRFTPRKKGSSYSRANIERMIWLEKQGLLHSSVRSEVLDIIQSPYEFPADIIEALQKDETIWAHYSAFPEAYKRIRVAYIDAARSRPQEFQKRLSSFLRKTKENKMMGYGGIDKYFIVETKSQGA